MGHFGPLSLLLDAADLRQELRQLQQRVYPQALHPAPHPGKLCQCLFSGAAGQVFSEYPDFHGGNHRADARCDGAGGLRLLPAAVSRAGPDLHPVSLPNDDPHGAGSHHKLCHHYKSGPAQLLLRPDPPFGDLGFLYLPIKRELLPGAGRAVLCRQG